MADKIQELKDKRAKVVADQQALLDKAGTEKRGLTADEETIYQNLDKDFDKYTDEITALKREQDSLLDAETRRQKLADRQKLLNQSTVPPTRPDPNPADPDQRNKGNFVEYRINPTYQPMIDGYRQSHMNIFSAKPYLDSYKRYLAEGLSACGSEARDILANADRHIRALQVDSDKSGGYLVVPEQMVYQIIEELDNIVFVRQYANVIPLPSAVSLGAPARDTDLSDLNWTSEILTGGVDTSLNFDKRSLTPHPLAKSIKVSKKLLRVAVIDIAAYISKAFARKMGYVEENTFLNGNGSNQPLGVFTASDLGISTARDVSTGNTTTAITADGLINCEMSLKKQYRSKPSNRWCFHRDAIKMIRKLKDGEGNYLWRMGISDKEDDSILGHPYEESEYAPNTFTTGKYVGILGDWSEYWIADALNMEIQVVTELYSATNQNGYFCRKETDGAPVLETAFARVKLA